MLLPLSVFYLYHLDFDADADAATRCGYSLSFKSWWLIRTSGRQPLVVWIKSKFLRESLINILQNSSFLKWSGSLNLGGQRGQETAANSDMNRKNTSDTSDVI